MGAVLYRVLYCNGAVLYKVLYCNGTVLYRVLYCNGAVLYRVLYCNGAVLYRVLCCNGGNTYLLYVPWLLTGAEGACGRDTECGSSAAHSEGPGETGFHGNGRQEGCSLLKLVSYCLFPWRRGMQVVLLCRHSSVAGGLFCSPLHCCCHCLEQQQIASCAPTTTCNNTVFVDVDISC